MDNLAQSIPNNGGEGLSELKDPFKAKCVKSINMTIDRDWSHPYDIRYTARIEFVNGGTEANQRLRADSLEALVKKVGSFLTSLE